MDYLNQHKIDFADGFQDGYLRAEQGQPCRWIEHIDQTDGFKSINPVYTLAYQCGYEFQKMGKELCDEKVDSLFMQLVKHCYSKHHNDNNI